MKFWSTIPRFPGWPRLFFTTGMTVSPLLDPAAQTSSFACCWKLFRDSSSDVCDIAWKCRYWLQRVPARWRGWWFMHTGTEGLQLDNSEIVWFNFQSASTLQCWRYYYNPLNANLIASSARMFRLLFLKNLSVSWSLLSKAPGKESSLELCSTVCSFHCILATVMPGVPLFW